MIFRQLNKGGCRTYLIGSDRTREAVLIDPVFQGVDGYLELIRAEGLKLRWVMDTHTHADHISGCPLIQKRAGVDYLMHANSAVACVSKRLKERDAIGFGEVTLTFLHTPGHTSDSLMALLPDRFLSGDFLFIGQAGAGRLDLPGGDVEAHYNSLGKLDALPEAAMLFPAHDYRGRDYSTLKAERETNPILKPKTRDEYLRYWRDLELGPAEWMKRVLAANSSGSVDPAAADAIPKEGAACEACAPKGPELKVPEVDPPKLLGWVRAGRAAGDPLWVLDVREPDEYAGELGHVAGATLIPLGALESRLSEVPKDKAVVTICKSGRRSARAAGILIKAGFSKVYSLAGGMLAWDDEELPVER